MEVVITTRHGNIDGKIEELIRNKAEKISHFYEKINRVTITIDLREAIADKIEIAVHVEHKHDIVASAENGEILSVFEAALDRLKLQITRHKEKIQDHRRDPSHKDHSSV